MQIIEKTVSENNYSIFKNKVETYLSKTIMLYL